MPTRICPRDRTPLVAEPHAGLSVDRCPTCQGIWLDAEEVVVAVEAAAEGTKPAPSGPWEPVRYGSCPVCGAQMARRNYERVSGVIVDTCPRHGTWLDAGELERIGAFVRSGGHVKTARAEARLQEEREEARRDLKRIDQASPMSTPGRWGSDALDLLDVLTVLF